MLTEREILKQSQSLLLENLVNLETESSERNCTWYGVLYNKPVEGDQNYLINYGDICLGALNRNDYNLQAAKAGFFIWHNCPDSENLRWWLSFILNTEDSPWRNLILAQAPQDFEFVVKYGYTLTNLDFPANFVVNFLTAFRLMYEKPSIVSLWRFLKETCKCSHGSIAAILDTVQSRPKNITLDTEINFSVSQGHFAFQLHDADHLIVERINNKEPCKLVMERTRLFSKNTSYSPCNAIWGGETYIRVSNSPLNRAFVNYINNRGMPLNSSSGRMFSQGEQLNSYSYSRNSGSIGLLKDFCLSLDESVAKTVKRYG